MRYYLGVDVGTSAVKTLLLDENQCEIAMAEVALKTNRARPGWSEQDPDDWWQAVVSCMRHVGKNHPAKFRKVSSIGVAGQMHGMIGIDKNGRPVVPAILWNDSRARPEAERLHQDWPDLAEKVEVLPMAGITAPKILWLKNNAQEQFDKIATYISAKDYINFKLTGRVVTDYSDASGTWLLDQQARRWSLSAASAVGLREEQLPELVESSAVIGTLKQEVSGELGLSDEVRVVGGGGDTPVGAIGLGCVGGDEAKISLGTSSHIFLPTKSYKPHIENIVHSFSHVLANEYYQMAALLNGANTVGWFSKIANKSIGELEKTVENNFNGPGDILFLPYLAGERTPLNNPNAKSIFFGLQPHHNDTDLYQAVLEGVAYSLEDGKRALLDS